MSTQTSFVAEQFRLQQWANQIKDCQNRPSDMKVDACCQEHSITKANILLSPASSTEGLSGTLWTIPFLCGICSRENWLNCMTWQRKK